MLSLEDIATFADPPRIDAECRTNTSYSYLGDSVGVCRVLSRYKMFVRTDDQSIAPCFIMDGYWEIWNSAAVARLVRPGMRVLDVGANLGYFSVLMADLVGPNGRVVSFEPSTRTSALLERSLAINGFSERAQVVRAAASDAAGRARLIAPKGQHGGASIMRGGDTGDDVEDVGMVRLDAWCAANSFRPDFIKIDAEGAEQKIWAGMAGLVDGGEPLTVMFEFDSGRWSDWREWLIGLQGKGFALQRVQYDGSFQSIDPHNADLKKGDLFEILAVRG